MLPTDLLIALDNIEIGYYESGAYYDSTLESYYMKELEALEKKYLFCLIEY